MSERKLKIVLPLVILAVGITAAVIMIKSRAPVATRPSMEYLPLVRVVETHPKTYQLKVNTQGTVRPRTESSLVSEVSGRVVEIAPSFAAGGFFKKNDVLLRIDPRDYELAVITARGQVAQAKVRAELEEAEAKVAREEWEALGNGDASPLVTRELQLQEARAALASAEAALEKAERNLKRTRIRAPFDGRVRDKMVDVGQFLSPGVQVATIFAIDYVEVRLPIPDSELAYLDLPVNPKGNPKAQNKVKVLLHADFAGKRHQWMGWIVRVEGEIDPVSRMVHAVAQVDNPYGTREATKTAPLTVGLFVEAEIFGREVENVIVLPRSAVRRNNKVLVADDENRLRFRDVEILRMDRTEAVISAGLAAEERVCVSVLEAVSDGMKVRTTTATNKPATSHIKDNEG